MIEEITITPRQEEFQPLEPGKIRTPGHEEYLKILYKQLHFLNEQGGRDLAEVLLKTVENTDIYKESIGGITEEESAKRKFDLDLLGLCNLCESGKFNYEDEEVHSRLEGLINFLENNKELNLTEDEYIRLKYIITEKGDLKDILRPRFWEISIKFFKEEDKNSVFLSSLKEFKLPELEKIILTSNDKIFICKMFLSIISSGIIDKISQETNTKFFNELFTNSETKVQILKGLLSINCKNLKECLEKLNPQMKEPLKLELKNDKTFIDIFNEVSGWTIGNFVALIESFGLTIPVHALPSDDKFKYLENDYLNKLSEFVPENEIKNALKEMFVEGDEKYIVGLTYLFKNGSLWGYVDEKYKTPEYLNPHMKIISEGFGLSNEDRIGLLNDLKKSEEIGEKYKACLVRDQMLWSADDKLVDLIIDTVELDENSNSGLLYREMKRSGQVDEGTILNIIKNIGDMRYFGEIDDLKNTIKQRVLGTENKELMVEFIKKFGKFYEICSKEEIDTLIRKFIHMMSYEDVKIFKDTILEMENRRKFSSSLLFKIKCFMGYVNVSKCTSLPKDVYIDAIKTGKLGLYTEQLPKIDVESPYIDTDDLNKLLEMLKIYDAKRSEENIKNIIQEVIDDGEKGEVIFNFTTQEQKYILGFDYEEQHLKFITENLRYHVNIFDKYFTDAKCFGGGRVKMNEKEKTITLFDSSEGYGRVEDDYAKAMIKMLEKKFPDYTIVSK